MTKSCLLVFASFHLLSSCIEKEPEAPLLDIAIEMSESSQWSRADVDVSYIRFFEERNEGLAISTLQNWYGNSLQFDLRLHQTKGVAFQEHWVAKLAGIDFNFINIILYENDNELQQRLDIEYVEFLPFTEPFVIENNKQYQILLTIDIDELTEAVPGGDITFKSSQIKASIREVPKRSSYRR